MFWMVRQALRGLPLAKPRFSPRVSLSTRTAQRAHTQGAQWQRAQPSQARRGQLPKQFAALRSGTYGTIFLSIALLVTDETLDWPTRQSLGIQAVDDVLNAETHEQQLEAFWILGEALLKAHSGTTPDFHEPIRPEEESGLADDLVVRLMTVPDPETPGKNLVLCQAAFIDEEDPEFYVATHSDRMADAAHSLFSGFEEFAKSHDASKGAMLIVHPGGSWYCLYYDGHRWLNLIFLEWQTAASIGLS
ncbi:hypothetical protein KJ359_005173 [Pestalotiopsis sp. 9143b]|nr:hypothetical protein KJ359_005173 [Pestalotiopsis sp. 9143b]